MSGIRESLHEAIRGIERKADREALGKELLLLAHVDQGLADIERNMAKPFHLAILTAKEEVNA